MPLSQERAAPSARSRRPAPPVAPALPALPGLFAILASVAIAAQERPTFSTQSELVVLHVTVEDRRGAYVGGLEQDAFTVFEDGKPQPVKFFSAADAPATIGLLIDNSYSMMNRRELVVAAAAGFTERSNPEDEVFVLAFNEAVGEIWAPKVIRDTNLASMKAVLLGNIAARGKTALYDAIAGGLDRLNKGKHARQVLVIISDGSDNASSATLDEVLVRTRSAEAAIFTVILRDPIDRSADAGLMKRLAHETGGEAFEPSDMHDVPKTLEHIARDIRSAYTIGYEPPPRPGDPTLRGLKVAVKAKDGRTFKVRSRAGYLAKQGAE